MNITLTFTLDPSKLDLCVSGEWDMYREVQPRRGCLCTQECGAPRDAGAQVLPISFRVPRQR